MPTCSFEVQLTGPLDIPQSLERFRRWGDDLMDRWDGTQLARTVRVANTTVACLCTPVGSREQPRFQVQVADRRQRMAVERAVAASFLPTPADFPDLLRRDAVIARLNDLYPGLREARQADLLAALVKAISAQQVNLRWAATTRKRLAEGFGQAHRIGAWRVYSLDAERLAATDPLNIRALQFTQRKAEYIVGVAQAIASGELRITDLAALPNEEVVKRLTRLRGIGRWTAEWILVRTLGRSRVVAGDLGVRKAVGAAYLNDPSPTEQTVRRATRHWGESACLAQALLLHGFAEGMLTTP